VYAQISNTLGGEPSEPGEVEVSLRHVVPFVVALSVAVWVAAVTASDHFLITIIALAFIGVLAVAVVKILIDEGFRTRARHDRATRLQYLTAWVLAVVLPIAVLVWALASQPSSPADPHGGPASDCDAQVYVLTQSGEYTQSEAEQLLGEADPACQ
jgi:site-specific recombinase